MTKKLSYNEVKKYIEENDTILLDGIYINNNTKMRVQCNNNHIYEINLSNFKQGKRCPECKKINLANKYRLDYCEVKRNIEKEGYKLLSKDYKNSLQKLKILCPEGHVYYSTYGNFYSGKRCGKCSNNTSKPEKEIYEYIKSFGLDIIENDRSIIRNPNTNYPLELDIFILELNKAIEFNGRYWHRKYKKVKVRDDIKKDQCKKKGIDLLVIKEQDWIDNKNICFSILNDFIFN